ncbi:MAG: dTDP-glucose 4,6-dehydratase, partial [Candidatus Marinimicrobia bacterium]|nr:dTDP-glucose 4,6-dehydratase [Candidatus Neomarinimicrobiota bacterium]
KNIEFVHGNINDQNLVSKIFKDFGITHIINFAAESHVDRSINDPSIFLETNILGTYNLLDCFKRNWEINNKPKSWRFLHISTDEVFGSLKIDEKPFSEVSSYKPRSPYAASKASSDHLVRAWHNTYDIPTLITNCSNNYGPFQFPEKLIPLTITNIIRGKKIPVYGDGLNIRDWLFVGDHCSAIDIILQKAIPGSTYCIGGNNELTNIDLINQICILIDEYAQKLNINLSKNKSSNLISYVEDRPGHDKRYSINSEKLLNELNWKPKIKFKDGLKTTVKWYLTNFSWWEPIIKINNH